MTNVPEEVRVIAENLIHDLNCGIRTQSAPAARNWLLLGRRKYPGLCRHMERDYAKPCHPRKLPAGAF